MKSKPDSLKRDSLIRVSVLGHDMDQGVLLYRNHHFTEEEIRKNNLSLKGSGSVRQSTVTGRVDL